MRIYIMGNAHSPEHDAERVGVGRLCVTLSHTRAPSIRVSDVSSPPPPPPPPPIQTDVLLGTTGDSLYKI